MPLVAVPPPAGGSGFERDEPPDVVELLPAAPELPLLPSPLPPVPDGVTAPPQADTEKASREKRRELEAKRSEGARMTAAEQLLGHAKTAQITSFSP